jgi:hypothetical protein
MNCSRRISEQPYLIADLDERNALLTLKCCLAAARVGKGKFATLMGVSIASLGRWLRQTQPIPPWALRAAYFAAMQSGVALRFNNPLLTPQQIDKALYKAPRRRSRQDVA